MAVDHVSVPREDAHFEKRSTFCDALLVGSPMAPTEVDHQMTWLTPNEALAVLSPPSHRWAVAEWRAEPGVPPVEARDRLVVHKAAACVVRTTARGPELLVFRHPAAGIQIPKGSVEPGEFPERAALRELAEESGITVARVRRQVGRHVFEIGGGPGETGMPELHLWHTFLFTVDTPLRDHWQHRVTGSEVEAGLLFEYSWIRIGEARRIAGVRYHPSIDAVARACESDFGGPSIAPPRGRRDDKPQ
jgi:8-oxo-dGTP pyrophosphatase MutT (NUDIX family)